MGSNFLFKALWYLGWTVFFSVLIPFICWITTSIKSKTTKGECTPFNNKVKRAKFIIAETLLCDLSIIAIPVILYYCKSKNPKNEIIILLVEGVSAYVLFFTFNVLPTLFKSILRRIQKTKNKLKSEKIVQNKIKLKDEEIDREYLGLIYNITLFCSFVILFLFYKKESNGTEKDIYDYLAYTFAPLLILIGNIFPLKCVFSLDYLYEYTSGLKGIRIELANNSIKIRNTILGTVIVNMLIGAFFLLPFLEPIVDSIWTPCLLGTTISLFIIKSSI